MTSPAQSREFLFIDEHVDDKQTLINSVAPNVTIIELNEKTNAIQQIASALKGQKNIDAIHIFSHGAEGELAFANGVLNNANLSSYATQLNKIGKSLTKSGDILLYGCDIANSTAGSAFINSIAKATKADVVASTDFTGATSLGGDWDLEAHTGTVEATVLSIPQWNGLFNVNNAPTAANAALKTNEDSALVLTAANFGFADIDTGDTLSSVRITALETAGTLQFNGTDVELQQVISKADIDLGKLSFTSEPDANGKNYANFRFKVNDGKSDSSSSYAMFFNVTPVTDVPQEVAVALNGVGTLQQPQDRFATSFKQIFPNIGTIPFISSKGNLFADMFGKNNLVVTHLMVTTTDNYVEISGVLSNGNRLTFYVGPHITAIDYLMPNGFDLGTYFPKIPNLNGIGLTNVEFVLATDGLTVNNPILGDTDVGRGFNLIALADLTYATNPIFKFIHAYLGVDSIGTLLNVDPITRTLALTAEINFNVTLLKIGVFSITETHLAYTLGVDVTKEPSIGVSNQIQITGYDPTQSNEPTLSLDAGFIFEIESISMFGSISASGSGWKNPYGLYGATIRNLTFQAGLTYIPDFLDNVAFILDIAWSTYDVNLAVSVDITDPEKIAFSLTLNKPINVVALMVQTEAMVVGGPASIAVIALLDLAEPLFNYIPFTIESLDSNGDHVLDPLVAFVPFPTDIGNQSIPEGLFINGKVQLDNLVGTLSFASNADFTQMQGSLRIQYLKVGDFLTISGIADGSDLTASFLIAPLNQYIAGDGKFVLFGQTLAQAHFQIAPTLASITDTKLALGPLAFNIHYLNYDLLALSASGNADVSMLGYQFAGLDFNFNSSNIYFNSFINFGVMGINGSFTWNTAANTLAVSGTMQVNRVAISNASINYNAHDGLIFSGGIDVSVGGGIGNVHASVGGNVNNGLLSALSINADISSVGHIGFSVNASDFSVSGLATSIYNKAFSQIGQLPGYVGSAVKDGVTDAFSAGSHFFTDNEATNSISHALDGLNNIGGSIVNLFGGNKEHNKTYVDSQNISQGWEGNGGNDVAFGNGGDDMLSGHQGNDILDGGAGNDTLYAGSNQDMLNGGDGNDYLDGAEGLDTLYGGSGDDILYGINPTVTGYTQKDDGPDELHGGTGNDILIGVKWDDILYGDAGFDTAIFPGTSNSASIGYSDSTNTFTVTTASGGSDTVSGVEAFQFDNTTWTFGEFDHFNALIYIASYPDLIAAFGANTNAGTIHYLSAGYREGRTGSFDALKYIASYPDLIRAYGANTDAGANHYISSGYREGRTGSFDALKYIASYPDLIAAFGSNTDAGLQHYIGAGYYEGRTASFDANFYLAKYPELRSSLGFDSQPVNIDVVAQQFISVGYAEGKTVHGDGSDYLTGSTLNDTLNSYQANDTLDGGLGTDTLYGGTGDDTYINDGADRFVENANEGTDTVTSAYTYTLPNNIENLTLIGNAEITGTGNALNNVLIGNSSTNVLIGGSGNDTLNSGGGADTLMGGDGNDVFQLTSPSKVTITDFLVANDTIQLENGIFTQLTTAGALNPVNFIIGSSAVDTNDYIIYNNNTGVVLYDADGSGAGVAIEIAMIGANLALTSANFAII